MKDWCSIPATTSKPTTTRTATSTRRLFQLPSILDSHTKSTKEGCCHRDPYLDPKKELLPLNLPASFRRRCPTQLSQPQSKSSFPSLVAPASQSLSLSSLPSSSPSSSSSPLWRTAVPPRRTATAAAGAHRWAHSFCDKMACSSQKLATAMKASSSSFRDAMRNHHHHQQRRHHHKSMAEWQLEQQQQQQQQSQQSQLDVTETTVSETTILDDEYDDEYNDGLLYRNHHPVDLQKDHKSQLDPDSNHDSDEIIVFESSQSISSSRCKIPPIWCHSKKNELLQPLPLKLDHTMPGLTTKYHNNASKDSKDTSTTVTTTASAASRNNVHLMALDGHYSCVDNNMDEICTHPHANNNNNTNSNADPYRIPDPPMPVRLLTSREPWSTMHDIDEKELQHHEQVTDEHNQQQKQPQQDDNDDNNNDHVAVSSSTSQSDWLEAAVLAKQSRKQGVDSKASPVKVLSPLKLEDTTAPSVWFSIENWIATSPAQQPKPHEDHPALVNEGDACEYHHPKQQGRTKLDRRALPMLSSSSSGSTSSLLSSSPDSASLASSSTSTSSDSSSSSHRHNHHRHHRRHHHRRVRGSVDVISSTHNDDGMVTLPTKTMQELQAAWHDKCLECQALQDTVQAMSAILTSTEQERQETLHQCETLEFKLSAVTFVDVELEKPIPHDDNASCNDHGCNDEIQVGSELLVRRQSNGKQRIRKKPKRSRNKKIQVSSSRHCDDDDAMNNKKSNDSVQQSLEPGCITAHSNRDEDDDKDDGEVENDNPIAESVPSNPDQECSEQDPSLMLFNTCASRSMDSADTNRTSCSRSNRNVDGETAKSGIINDNNNENKKIDQEHCTRNKVRSPDIKNHKKDKRKKEKSKKSHKNKHSTKNGYAKKRPSSKDPKRSYLRLLEKNDPVDWGYVSLISDTESDDESAVVHSLASSHSKPLAAASDVIPLLFESTRAHREGRQGKSALYDILRQRDEAVSQMKVLEQQVQVLQDEKSTLAGQVQKSAALIEFLLAATTEMRKKLQSLDTVTSSAPSQVSLSTTPPINGHSSTSTSSNLECSTHQSDSTCYTSRNTGAVLGIQSQSTANSLGGNVPDSVGDHTKSKSQRRKSHHDDNRGRLDERDDPIGELNVKSSRKKAKSLTDVIERNVEIRDGYNKSSSNSVAAMRSTTTIEEGATNSSHKVTVEADAALVTETAQKKAGRGKARSSSKNAIKQKKRALRKYRQQQNANSTHLQSSSLFPPLQLSSSSSSSSSSSMSCSLASAGPLLESKADPTGEDGDDFRTGSNRFQPFPSPSAGYRNEVPSGQRQHSIQLYQEDVPDWFVRDGMSALSITSDSMPTTDSWESFQDRMPIAWLMKDKKIRKAAATARCRHRESPHTQEQSVQHQDSLVLENRTPWDLGLSDELLTDLETPSTPMITRFYSQKRVVHSSPTEEILQDGPVRLVPSRSLDEEHHAIRNVTSPVMSDALHVSSCDNLATNHANGENQNGDVARRRPRRTPTTSISQNKRNDSRDLSYDVNWINHEEGGTHGRRRTGINIDPPLTTHAADHAAGSSRPGRLLSPWRRQQIQRCCKRLNCT